MVWLCFVSFLKQDFFWGSQEAKKYRFFFEKVSIKRPGHLELAHPFPSPHHPLRLPRGTSSQDPLPRQWISKRHQQDGFIH